MREALTLVLALGCTGTPPPDPGLTPTQLTSFVRSDATDRAGWAADVHAALLSAGKIPDADHACQVLATIEQESGYEADPEVPGLSSIVLTELEAEVDDTLGFLGPSALALLIVGLRLCKERGPADRLPLARGGRERGLGAGSVAVAPRGHEPLW